MSGRIAGHLTKKKRFLNHKMNLGCTSCKNIETIGTETIVKNFYKKWDNNEMTYSDKDKKLQLRSLIINESTPISKKHLHCIFSMLYRKC